MEEQPPRDRPHYTSRQRGQRLGLFSGLYVVVMAVIVAAASLVTGRSFGEQLGVLWIALVLCYLAVLYVALRGTGRDT